MSDCMHYVVRKMGTGTVGDKHVAWCDMPDGRWTGPERETEAEAIADRDKLAKVAEAIIKKRMPNAIITKGKIQ